MNTLAGIILVAVGYQVAIWYGVKWSWALLCWGFNRLSQLRDEIGPQM